MNKNEQPGISINRIILAESHFHRSPQISDDFENSISISVTNDNNKKNNSLITKLELTLNKVDAPIYAKVVYIGFFSVVNDTENMTLEEFSTFSAPAILIPYAREEIQNRLLKADLPKFAILPPINLMALEKKILENPSTTNNDQA